MALSDEKRKKAVSSIIDFFKTERKEDIGIIAAESILDFFVEEVGSDIYNSGVDDARKAIKGRLEDMELDLETLYKS